MTKFKRPGSVKEILERNTEVETKYHRDRFQLSIGAAEYIVDELHGSTQNIGLYAIAMYALHGPTEEKEKKFKELTESLDAALGGDLIASVANDKIVGTYRLPDELPKTGLWNFEVKLCYVNSENHLGSFVGDLMLDDEVELGTGSYRTLSKKWLNHGYEGNSDEQYCDGVLIGLRSILDGGISATDADRLKGLL